LLRPEFGDCYGFTEPEVVALLEKAGRSDLLGPVRSWYNGYVFGGETVYNPWSILNFIASDDKLLRGYWVSTSANDLVRDLLVHHALDVETDMTALLEGDAIERRVDENVVLTDLRERPDALYDLLVFSGYLKAEAGTGVPGEEPAYRLSIPNREVREIYASTFRRWMETRLEGHRGSLRKLTSALLEGDAELLEEQIQTFVTNLLSYHDPAGIDPERVYHGFMVGLLAIMEPAYQVRSNRESGRGRPDVMIRPAQTGKPGVILELKVAKPPRRTLEQALEEGVTLLLEKDYGADLRAAGATPVHSFVVAFDGKTVRVRRADSPQIRT
jgi:PD-(D/E)XK nuclease superfamily/Predicted AAA-ATPase